MEECDVIIIGAGAAGLMCAIEAGKRGRKVWLVDHAAKIAEKIRISGGGRCNFTNTGTGPDNFLSQNPHFCKSALTQYSQQDFVAMVERYGIAYHEKALGQLFCDHKAQDIIDMLLAEAAGANVQLDMQTDIVRIEKTDSGFHVATRAQKEAEANDTPTVTHCAALVIATGGLSIPKIGATKFGYEVAWQFGLGVVETRAALVPLTFQAEILARCKSLAGVSVDAIVSCAKKGFSEAMLFTHRGLSGPSILQISSYWREGLAIEVNLAPQANVAAHLLSVKARGGKAAIETVLSDIIPKRLAMDICQTEAVSGRLVEIANSAIDKIGAAVNHWQLKPAGSEGYRTAEVTLGGVDTAELSSKTMQAKNVNGLFFIGEVVDVTGHLGGYNFQWAWSSGFVAGQNV
ncbi:MAG: NAD(P)/FAD-dependent oxidoreductase [Alphaproteobacteria bacterium]|nr:NAD(P)/FAD-dependent oxidoreductase [Alphaproteobacteria bacterium]